MDSAAVEAPPVAAQPQPQGRQGAVFAGVLLCFLLSGFAALLYQTAWMRQFSIVFGTSELAIATVLAAYMAGLALGSAIAGRTAHRIRRPVLTYGLLELGVALGALAVPFGLQLARGAQTAMIGGQASPPDAGAVSQSLFYLVVAFAIIVVPTAFMGATLPILTRHAVHENSQVGPRIGLLYATNTAGAVLGALVAAFFLLPELGLGRTVWVGVAVNAAIFLVAVLLSSAAGKGAALERETSTDAGSRGRRWWILPLILVSGVTSFTYEVLWTRLLAHVLDGSIYAFATMLASFLTGITLGSAVAARFAKTPRSATTGFIVAQLGTAILSIAVYLTIDRIPDLVGDDAAGRVKMSMLVLLPPTIFIGATFPFALRIFARDEHDASSASGRVYAWNTVGAILGAVVAGFFVIPGLGFHGALQFTVALNLLIALATAFLYERGGHVAKAVVGLAALALLIGFRPSPPDQLLRMSPMRGIPAGGRLVYEAVGRSATVLMLEENGSYSLRTNGLPEADVLPHGAVPLSRNDQVLLTVLPCFARPQAQTLLSIGFGGGVLLERVPQNIQSIDAIELEPEVIAANKAISPFRDVDPFADARLTVIENDARSALALTDKRYDIIVSQPSHPWTAGASHLYTREFIEQAKGHLNEDGVFLQWMSASFVTEELLKILGSTMLDSFEHARMYRPDPYFLLFIGSDSPLEVERDMVATGIPFDDPRSRAIFGNIGFQSVEDMATILGLDDAGLTSFCEGSPVNTDDRNYLAMRSKANLEERITLEELDTVLLEHDPLLRAGSDYYSRLGRELDLAYMVARLASRGLGRRAQAVLETIQDSTRRNLAAARMLGLVGDAQGAARSLEAALDIQRGGGVVDIKSQDPDVLFSYLHDNIYDVAAGTAEPLQLEVAKRLPDPYKAVIEAAGAEAQGDWARLASLDTRLELAIPRHECYPDAMRLRAIWRCNVADPSSRASYGRDAMILVDRALAVYPQIPSFQVRIYAALAADRPNGVIETFSALTRYLTHETDTLASAEQEQVRGILQQALAYLPTIVEDPRIRPERVGELTQFLQRLLGNS